MSGRPANSLAQYQINPAFVLPGRNTGPTSSMWLTKYEGLISGQISHQQSQLFPWRGFWRLDWKPIQRISNTARDTRTRAGNNQHTKTTPTHSWIGWSEHNQDFGSLRGRSCKPILLLYKLILDTVQRIYRNTLVRKQKQMERNGNSNPRVKNGGDWKHLSTYMILHSDICTVILMLCCSWLKDDLIHKLTVCSPINRIIRIIYALSLIQLIFHAKVGMI